MQIQALSTLEPRSSFGPFVQQEAKRRLQERDKNFTFMDMPIANALCDVKAPVYSSICHSRSNVSIVKNLDDSVNVIKIPRENHLELFNVRNSANIVVSPKLQGFSLCQGGFFECCIICLFSNGPVTLNHVKNLVIIVTSHQLRLKQVTNSVILLHTTASEIIVESSTGVSYCSFDGDRIIEPQYIVNDVSSPNGNRNSPSCFISNFFGKTIAEVLELSPMFYDLSHKWKELPKDSLNEFTHSRNF